MTERHTIVSDDSAAPDDLQIVHQGLRRFNREHGGLADPRALRLFVRNAAGNTLGGLLGYTLGAWLHIDNFWLDEAIRRNGYGTRLLQQAEDEAIARGCRIADLTTFDFQSPRFYEKNSYELFGELNDVAPGHTLRFYRKALRS
jgi:GNAT superfamily N-acetyltransferase